MAKKATKAASTDATVTRIKAGSESTSKPAKKQATPMPATKEATTQKARKKPSAKGIARPFVAIGQYFAGSWYELKQVRWPTRGATWSLTVAVLVYSAFFTVLVLALDALFKLIFDLIIGK